MFFHLPTMYPQEMTQSAQPAVIPNFGKIVVGGNSPVAPKIQKLTEDFQTTLPFWKIFILDGVHWKAIKEMNPKINTGDNAYSLLGTGYTFVNEDWFLKAPDDRLRQTLSHELGHLTVNTDDEDKANKWAREFMKARSKKK